MKVTRSESFLFSCKIANFLVPGIFLLFFLGCERNTDSSFNDDGLPPAIPTGLNLVYESDGEVWFEWTSPTTPDIKSYAIYRSINDTLNFQKIAVRNVNYFFDDSLEYNRIYYYKITAIDVFGIQSEYSTIIKASPINRFHPITPKDCAVFGTNWEGDTFFLIQWQKPVESDIDVIEIYRGTVPEFICDSSTLRGKTKNIFFEDRGDFNYYENYYYKLIAVDKGGLKSSPSNYVNDKILPLVRPLSPINDTLLTYLQNFTFIPLTQPARYRIVVQKNPFTDEIWNTDFDLSGEDSVFSFTQELPYLESGSRYFWRVEVFTKPGYPNSITAPQSFILE